MMTVAAFALLCVAGTLSCLAVLGLVLTHGRTFLGFAHGATMAVALALIAASGVLTGALANGDFSLSYVASYTDRALPMFYKVTAFWAGQAGSLLFWALTVALSGAIFLLTTTYGSLSADTKRWHNVFFLTITAFFSLLLTTYSNPFMQSAVIPTDGNGLNPLLQNPGMIFHPPLLFLGYGGFTIPACLALAQTVSGQRRAGEEAWLTATRPFLLSAWAFLTAGIVLGAWWAYMELGWGGYWAWDPVENASLIPWLVATAILHTGAIEHRRGNLSATNVFLIALTMLSAFFATYLVRSGIVQSVHAFGDGGVGTPLLTFVLGGAIICICVARAARKPNSADLAGLESREGFLVLTTWLLLILALIILVATLWPVITACFGTSHGLKADFYNRVCMPLFAALITMLAVCPWLKWTGGLRSGRWFMLTVLVLIAAMGCLWASGYRLSTAIMGSGSAIAVIFGVLLLFTVPSAAGAVPARLIHLAVAIIAIAIAFSGPFKTEKDITLKPGETAVVGDYSVTLKDVEFGDGPDYVFAKGILTVAKGLKTIGTLTPERRIHEKWRDMQFAEASTIFSLGTEVYASLLAVDDRRMAQIRISLNPLVNWLWIGGALLSVLPFLAIRRLGIGKRQAC